MKLYYSTGSCSMSCHIAAEEAGIPYEGIEVSWERNVNVDALEKLNPLGVVPAAVNEKGGVLTQNAAILEYIAGQKPASKLLAPAGTWERAQTLSWLSFVAADFHKAFSPLFMASLISQNPQAQDDVKKFARNQINGYLKHIDQNLAGKQYITGDDFTIADAYLLTVLGWCKWMEIDTSPYANVQGYTRRAIARPAVRKVLETHDMLTEY